MLARSSNRSRVPQVNEEIDMAEVARASSDRKFNLDTAESEIASCDLAIVLRLSCRLIERSPPYRVRSMPRKSGFEHAFPRVYVLSGIQPYQFQGQGCVTRATKCDCALCDEALSRESESDDR